MKYLVSLILVLLSGSAMSSDLQFPNISPRSSSSSQSSDSSQDNSSIASLPSVSSKTSSESSSPPGRTPRANLRTYSPRTNIDVRDDEFSYRPVPPQKMRGSFQKNPRAMPGRSIEEKKLNARNKCIDRITQAFKTKNLDDLIAVSEDQKCQRLSELNYLNSDYISSVRHAVIEIKNAIDLVKSNLDLINFNKDGRNGLERYRTAADILNRTWEKYDTGTNNLKKY